MNEQCKFLSTKQLTYDDDDVCASERVSKQTYVQYAIQMYVVIKSLERTLHTFKKSTNQINNDITDSNMHTDTLSRLPLIHSLSVCIWLNCCRFNVLMLLFVFCVFILIHIQLSHQIFVSFIVVLCCAFFSLLRLRQLLLLLLVVSVFFALYYTPNLCAVSSFLQHNTHTPTQTLSFTHFPRLFFLALILFL